MKKNFVLNFILLFVVNLLVKPAWLYTDLMVQRETGEDYGLYFVLFNFSMLFNMLLDFGITNYNNRKIAANENKFKNYFSYIFSLRLVLAGIYLIVLLLSGWFLGYQKTAFYWLFVLGINQILLAAITYFRSNLTALKFFKWDSLVSVTDRIIMCSIILYLIFSANQKVNISLFVNVQFYGYLFTAILALIILVYKGGWVKPTWNWKFNLTVLKKSYPYALIVVLMSAYSYSDSIMLDQMLDNGKWENMIYAQSFRILMAGNSYVYLISVLLLPLFAKLIQEKKEVQSLLKLSGTVVIFGTIVFVIIAYVYALELMSLLYAHYDEWIPISERFSFQENKISNAEEVKYSAKVFSYLILGLVPMSFNYIYGVLLTAGGKMKILNQIALLGLGGNVILNLFLIPMHGALGAAIASIITQSLCAFGQWYFAYKEHKISFPFLHFLKFAVLILFTLNLSIYFHENFKGILGIIVICISVIPYFFMVRFIKITNIKSLIKK